MVENVEFSVNIVYNWYILLQIQFNMALAAQIYSSNDACKEFKLFLTTNILILNCMHISK